MQGNGFVTFGFGKDNYKSTGHTSFTCSSSSRTGLSGKFGDYTRLQRTLCFQSSSRRNHQQLQGRRTSLEANTSLFKQNKCFFLVSAKKEHGEVADKTWLPPDRSIVKTPRSRLCSLILMYCIESCELLKSLNCRTCRPAIAFVWPEALPISQIFGLKYGNFPCQNERLFRCGRRASFSIPNLQSHW